MKQFFLESLYFKKPGVRTVLYMAFAVVTFIKVTPCIASGIFLLISAILNIFAQINQTVDEEAANHPAGQLGKSLV